MAPEAESGTSSMRTSTTPQVYTPSTPGIWSVSHHYIHRAQASSLSSEIVAPSFDLVTDVSFVWSYPAKSAFVTGTFSNWETTVAMTLTNGVDGPIWVLSKALPPGNYQYKFIIDNVWRHAPDQPVVYDERGIINNVLSVTVEACGDVTCFCSSFFAKSTDAARINPEASSSKAQIAAGIMTPKTIKRFQRNIGVAYKYVEKDTGRDFRFQKGPMYTEISDRPFDVTVINVSNLAVGKRFMDDHEAGGTISRASSFENIHEDSRQMGSDPNVPVVADPVYAAIINDAGGTLPHTAPNRAYALSGDPTELAYAVRARFSSPVLGFNPKECRDGIQLTHINHCATRTHERGLYKSVRAVLPLRRDVHRVYFEFFVLRQPTGGGVCLGLATRELPLNCVCGTRPNSIGFSTSGSLVQTVDGKETWKNYGDVVGSGSTVGFLVGTDHRVENSRNNKASRRANIEIFVDGRSRGNVDYEFVGDLDVFPTLSLLTKNTRVFALFNGHDMLFASCLPQGEDIVTLDRQNINRDSSNTPQSLGLAEGNRAK